MKPALIYNLLCGFSHELKEGTMLVSNNDLSTLKVWICSWGKRRSLAPLKAGTVVQLGHSFSFTFQVWSCHLHLLTYQYVTEVMVFNQLCWWCFLTLTDIFSQWTPWTWPGEVRSPHGTFLDGKVPQHAYFLSKKRAETAHRISFRWCKWRFGFSGRTSMRCDHLMGPFWMERCHNVHISYPKKGG